VELTQAFESLHIINYPFYSCDTISSSLSSKFRATKYSLQSAGTWKGNYTVFGILHFSPYSGTLTEDWEESWDRNGSRRDFLFLGGLWVEDREYYMYIAELETSFVSEGLY
jgi:hypothetical protein